MIFYKLTALSVNIFPIERYTQDLKVFKNAFDCYFIVVAVASLPAVE